MKYKLIRLGLIFFTTFYLLNSCNDEFLERYPLDTLSDPTYWKTESDLKNFNNSIYDLTGNVAGFVNDVINIGHGATAWDSHKKGIWYLDIFSDNLASDVVNSRLNDLNEIRAGKHYVQEPPRIYGWAGWNQLREMNYGIANYHRAPISQNIKNKYMGEARFFRAWFYSDKVQKFGDVPWISKPLNIDSEELYGTRTPREQVMDSVLADINFAVEYLPENWSGEPKTAQNGRFNKWHALLMKSRICLFEGTWRKYHGGSNPDLWLAEAASAAKQIIDNGPYSVFNTGNPESDYNSYFRKYDLSGNPEVMYWREYKSGLKTHEVMFYYTFTSGGATKSMVDDYLCTNGDPVVTKEGINPLYMGDDQIEDVFENRDPRMIQTILAPGEEEAIKYNYYHTPGVPYPILKGMGGGKFSYSGYNIIKFFNREDLRSAWGTGYHPAILMRYAEVLLNYAEAKAELGTITQADLDISINQLRDRVNMPHLDLGDVPDDPRYEDISPIITEVRRERRIELFSEGFRYMDLKRWKQGLKLNEPNMGMRWDDAAKERYPVAVTKGFVKSKVILDPITNEMKEYINVVGGTTWDNPVFDESKHYLWPIPVSAISQNPNLEQTIGW
jgi:starch-binding outer membrane protein, SusD/RagB family